MHLHLDNQVAIVTGSSRGLGLASARALADEGCRVVLCARGARRARRRLRPRSSRAAGRATSCSTVAADVATADGAERVVAPTLDAFGRIDILVNNVGKAGGGDIVSTLGRRVAERASIRRSFPAIRMSRLVVPHMRTAGRRRDSDDRVDLGPRVRRPHDLQRREGRRNQPREGDGAAAGDGQHPRQQRRARLDPLRRRILVEAPAGGSRRASPSSSAASFRSAASARPRKSATSSRFSRRRAPAGSPAPASPSTAVRSRSNI